LKITTRRWNGGDHDVVDGFPADDEIHATIDWDAIEALETLADV